MFFSLLRSKQDGHEIFQKVNTNTVSSKMALNRAHSSAKAADVTKLLLGPVF